MCTFLYIEIEDVLAASRNMWLIFRREDMSLQIGEIDGGMATFGSTHPSRRGDKVGYESCPNRSAAQCLAAGMNSFEGHLLFEGTLQY